MLGNSTLDNTFTNREIAIAMWFAIGLFWSFRREKIRSSMLRVANSFFQRKILAVAIALVVYTGVITALLHHLNIWRASNLKETVYWTIFTGFAAEVSITDLSKNKDYFISFLKDNIKLSVFIEYIVNAFSFSLAVELILVPMLLFLVLLKTVAELKEEHQPVKIITEILLAIFAICIISYSGYSLYNNFYKYATIYELISLLIPVLFTIFAVPFLYALAVFIEYDTLFTRIDFFLGENHGLVQFTKSIALKSCGFNIKAIKYVQRGIAIGIRRDSTREEILGVISEMRSAKDLGNLELPTE